MPPFFLVIQGIHARMLKREIEERSLMLSAAAPPRLLKRMKEVRGGQLKREQKENGIATSTTKSLRHIARTSKQPHSIYVT
jgi:hypothetical protein